ncbi:HD1 protein [Gelatoporia subvermispora B]|uniref:HD1 protein n=1 Tax=Ceriporiopsis subvermispora (strain B) TaxID=914234 RepID=M2QXR1_CERS8|nr:HD1 protein [Gelatoporia subvermispora B]
MSTIRDRLQAAEEELLLAVNAGNNSGALQRFDERWSALQAEVLAASQAGTIDADTIQLAQAVSGRVAIIAQAFIDLDETAERLGQQLARKVDRIVNQATQGPPGLPSRLRGAAPGMNLGPQAGSSQAPAQPPYPAPYHIPPTLQSSIQATYGTSGMSTAPGSLAQSSSTAGGTAATSASGSANAARQDEGASNATEGSRKSKSKKGKGNA